MGSGLIHEAGEATPTTAKKQTVKVKLGSQANEGRSCIIAEGVGGTRIDAYTKFEGG